MTQNNKFNCFIPLEFEKSNSKNKEDRYKNMVFWGMASDNSEDSDGEMLEPSGYDLSGFLAKGMINLEHYTTRKGDSKYWIGEPLDAKIKNNELYVKGKLWEKHPLARSFWDTIQIMKESNSTRKPGMSIEGSVIQRDPNNPKRVLKAKINNLAVTMSPKNSNSWLDIVKGKYEEAYIKPEFDEAANGGAEYILDVTYDNGYRLTIDKDFKIKVQKAMSAGTQTGTELTGKITSGASLKKESVEKKVKNLQKEYIFSAIDFLAKKHKEKSLSDKLLKNLSNNLKIFLNNK